MALKYNEKRQNFDGTDGNKDENKTLKQMITFIFIIEYFSLEIIFLSLKQPVLKKSVLKNH